MTAASSIADLVACLRGRQDAQRRKAAVQELAALTQSKAALADSARDAGVVPLLTRLLGQTDDEEVLDAAAAIIAACSGPMASAGKVTEYCYDRGLRVRIREGALGDGLGAKVWMVAHMLCQELARYPAIVAGQQVLEIGSGCGLCGVAAARAGAAHVVMSDVEGPVLRNLRCCMHLNAERSADGSTATATTTGIPAPPAATAASGGTAVAPLATAQQLPAVAAAKPEPESDSETAADLPLEHEAGSSSSSSSAGGGGSSTASSSEADSGSDCEEQQQGTGCCEGEAATAAATASSTASSSAAPPATAATTTAPPSSSWELPSMSVRYLDWCESRDMMDSSATTTTSTQDHSAPASRTACPGGPGAGCTAGAAAAPCGGGSDEVDLPPRVPPQQRFPVIIGSEVMYERAHAELVAAVLAHRLAPGGRALLFCAVRELRVFAHFAAECARRGLRYRRCALDPAATRNGGSSSAAAGDEEPSSSSFEGIIGRSDQYEGGFLMMAVDRLECPCSDWHRDDFECVCA